MYINIKKLQWLIPALFFSLNTSGQLPAHPLNEDLSQRISMVPARAIDMILTAGMSVKDHPLTDGEKTKVEKAFAILPALYLKILRAHLQSISFVDNLPNTGLASRISDNDTAKMFNITIRAGILHETVSEWATWKENTCYDHSENPDIEISVEAGSLDAIQYVLFHEATHVVADVLKLTPIPVINMKNFTSHFEDNEVSVEPTPLTKGIWYKTSVPAEKYIDTLLEKTRFRRGKAVSASLAPEIYRALGKTPFASLYAMSSWDEDIAELASVYYLTSKMKQPFRFVVKKNNKEIASYAPMKNKLVKKRLKQLSAFTIEI